ncbi:MAG: EAL domain-containing protein [Methylobacteriaceae bacterium]|nr:EAL domain-containing protein [Methylobacteriaceae bacterium]
MSAPNPANLATQSGPTPQALAAPRILIVDDIADNRIILMRRFQRAGFETFEASGGLQALAMIARDAFDIVLLDVMMPEMDGLQVLRMIRATHAESRLPVIMVTAKSQSEDIVTALSLGANDYVTKPVDFPVALARVRTQLERKRAEETVREANEALRLVNEQLEQRIEERTARLRESNEQLKAEILQRQQSEQRSHYLAYHDALTRLPNRLLFREELERILDETDLERASLAAMFIDLDGFKNINDTLGHSFGDMLLSAVADRIRGLLMPDDVIARLGGDEFAIVQVAPQQPQNAATLAARIIDAVSAPYIIDGQELSVGASIGIAVAGPGDRDPELLLKNADLAMYRAKSDGRGAYRVFNADMDASAQARRMLEMELRAALSHGQLDLHFQPLVDIESKRVSTFEALLRWRHPTRGFVSPVEFIPIAEEAGLIVQIGEWVLRRACLEAVKWPAEINVAVNLSPVQFARANLVPSVVNALAASGLPASRLELEVTESVMLEKSDRNLQTLGQLRQLGVRISMDDFGTGYSSLGYLRDFHFDKIKIDRSFVSDVAANAQSRAIVRAIAGLGASFGIKTSAEGVETAEQLACLQSDGYTEIQGRLYSMPVPADQIPVILKQIES